MEGLSWKRGNISDTAKKRKKNTSWLIEYFPIPRKDWWRAITALTSLVGKEGGQTSQVAVGGQGQTAVTHNGVIEGHIVSFPPTVRSTHHNRPLP